MMALEAFAKTTSDSVIVPISLRMTLTLAPLKNIIFEDPISGKYGIEGHTEFEHVHNKK